GGAREEGRGRVGRSFSSSGGSEVASRISRWAKSSEGIEGTWVTRSETSPGWVGASSFHASSIASSPGGTMLSGERKGGELERIRIGGVEVTRRGPERGYDGETTNQTTRPRHCAETMSGSEVIGRATQCQEERVQERASAGKRRFAGKKRGAGKNARDEDLRSWARGAPSVEEFGSTPRCQGPGVGGPTPGAPVSELGWQNVGLSAQGSELEAQCRVTTPLNMRSVRSSCSTYPWRAAVCLPWIAERVV